MGVVGRPPAFHGTPPQEHRNMQDDQPLMTAKQEAIYHFIRRHIETKGFPPAIRDICDEFGISSPNGVMCHLKALQKKGYINRVEKRENQMRGASPQYHDSRRVGWRFQPAAGGGRGGRQGHRGR